MTDYLDENRSVPAFRRAVPQHLQPFILTPSGKPRTEWRFSLRTTDKALARERCRIEAVKTDMLIREAEARFRASREETTKSPDQRARERVAWEWEREADELRRSDFALDEEAYEGRESIRQALIARLSKSPADLSPAEAAVRDLIPDEEFDPPEVKAQRQRNIERQWAEGAAEFAEKFAASKSEAEAVPSYPKLGQLFERYVSGGSAKPATVKAWRRMIAHLENYLGHDDASRISRADVSAWTDALRAERDADGRPLRGAKTVREGYLTALKVSLEAGTSAGLLSENVANGVIIRGPKRQLLRSPDLTEHEALTILRAALQPQSPRLSPETILARRWVPWICAYTGARVNEITQMRAEDVAQRDGIWAIRITPEAGSQKSNRAWWVPLHSHLVEQGFPEVARAKGLGPLFYNPDRARGGSEANPQRKKVGEYLAKWVRKIGVDDPNVQPNHGWRHLFKTRARDADLDPEAREAIPGHAASTVGRSYGTKGLAFLSREIEKLPRFRIDAEEA